MSNMSSKKITIIVVVVAIIVAIIVGIVVMVKKLTSPKVTTNNANQQVELPVNTIPVEERPFITLSPDNTGHNLTLSVDNAPKEGDMEYELVYNASGKQEGALGTLMLASETQPIEKEILLGSRSAGGATTYHEGVTGGSFSVIYGTDPKDPNVGTKLKEQFNFLHFDPTDPVMTSPDVRFSVEFEKAAFKEDTVITTMKTFGLPIELSEGNLVAGPYAYFSPTVAKGNVEVAIKLPAGEHVNPTILEFDEKSGEWVSLETVLVEDEVKASATGNVFVVTTE